jgi:2-(1,2-epoxy-1,2-dihydrophenyl)acetyl-CoA isomerase
MTSVLTRDEGMVRVITLNRPDRLNALDAPTRAALLAALNDAVERDDVRVIVLTGAGRAFCTGQDVSASDELVDADATVRDTYNPLAVALRCSPKPVIAAINGPAVGAGLGLALACDLRLIAETAYLACSFSRVGLVPDTGTSTMLVRLLGHAHAFEVAVSARKIAADEALATRLVNEVVEDDRLTERALELARGLADGPALAYTLTKQQLVAAAQQPEADLLELEAKNQGIAAASDDHKRAVASFLSRRS